MKTSSRTTSGEATDMIAGICTFLRLPCPCTKRHVMLTLPLEECAIPVRLGMDGPCRSTKLGGLSDFVSHTWYFLVSLWVHAYHTWSITPTTFFHDINRGSAILWSIMQTLLMHDIYRWSAIFESRFKHIAPNLHAAEVLVLWHISLGFFAYTYCGV